MDLKLFNLKELQHFNVILELCKKDGIGTVAQLQVSINEYITAVTEKVLKEPSADAQMPSARGSGKTIELPKTKRCPSCNKGWLEPLTVTNKFKGKHVVEHSVICRKCRYSEYVEDLKIKEVSDE